MSQNKPQNIPQSTKPVTGGDKTPTPKAEMEKGAPHDAQKAGEHQQGKDKRPQTEKSRASQK